MATWNTGEWFAMVVLDTVDKVKFWYFLKLLETILRRCSNSSQKSPIIIFDNAATHSSYMTKSIIKEFDLQVRFGAPYWPEVAPVERIFGKIKSKLRALGGSLGIHFGKRKRAELIFCLINSICIDSFLSAWIDVIKEARMTIVDILVRRTIRDESL